MQIEMSLDSFNQAVETLGLVGKIDRKTVRHVYLLLCKEYHPDRPNGDRAMFQKINDAYKLIMHYIDNFRFDFDEREYKKQYPLYDAKSGMWLGER